MECKHNYVVYINVLVCELCNLYLPRSAIGFTPTGHIDSVPKQTVTRHPVTHHSSYNVPTVDTNTHLLGGET